MFQHVIPFPAQRHRRRRSFPCRPALPGRRPSDCSAASLREVTVTGNPLGATDLIAPTTTLSGDALLLRSQSTLGETLNGLPGVSSTYFGPNASRPSIRGQDGDRIRILQNGGAAPDASALSYDHAVPVDALVTERIEVLRGPSALQYGGSAVGGVVNVIDNRIPSEPIDGFGGRADLGYATGNREKSGGVVLEGGNNRYALHVDAFNRDADDVAVPIELGLREARAGPALARKICNSANQARRRRGRRHRCSSTRAGSAPRPAPTAATTARWPRTTSPSA